MYFKKENLQHEGMFLKHFKNIFLEAETSNFLPVELFFFKIISTDKQNCKL